jgi:hypothetical protein
MKRLMFEVAPGDTADPDQPVSWGSARKEDHMSIKEHVYGSTKEHVYGEVDSAGDLKRISRKSEAKSPWPHPVTN